MNLSNFNYKDNYDLFIKYLYTYQDLDYLKFHSKLVKDKFIIGIRIPILKKIAKEISKSNYEDFIKHNRHKSYEEDMIYGLVLGYIKCSFKELINYLKVFIPYNDNWALNDTVCANLKAFKSNQEEGYKFILKLLNSKKDWYIRFALDLLLDYYINDFYIDKLFNIIDSVKSDNYYVEMANAWLISICFIKYPDKTMKYLLNNNLDKFTFNKSIDKICDSYRVDKNIKQYLKSIKR
jgi:3-methyladenine DNA glycosylase AlkD